MISVPIASTVCKTCFCTSLKLLSCVPVTYRSTGKHLFSLPPSALANICFIKYHAAFYLRHGLALSGSIMEAVLGPDH
jgi:hypothetical protein